LRASNAVWRHFVVIDDHRIRVWLPGLISNGKAIRRTVVLWPFNSIHKWQTSVADRPSFGHIYADLTETKRIHWCLGFENDN
jgi:hypothetical protein